MAIHASRQEQLAKRFRPSAACRNRNRRLFLERLENRELLAVLASDGFDSGNFAGGTGWAATSWSVSGSGALVQSTNAPHSGSHHALLRNNAGQIQRAVNVAGLSEVKLQFWAKINSFESGDQGLVQISSSGTSWTTIHTFTSAHSNNQYQFYNLTIPVTGSTLHVRFDAAMDQANDQWFLDDVQVIHTPPLPAGLVAWWTGNGTASDETGNHNATLVNGATYAAGQVGQAFKLDGVNDRVQVADSPSLALTQSLSIEAWIKADGLPSEQGEIFFRGDDRGGLDPYSLSLQPNGQLRWQVVSGPDAAEVWSPIPLGQFVHVAATLDDATGQLSLYLNGVLASQTVTSVRPFGALSPTSNPGIGIGNHGGSPATPHNFPFKGLIDELKVHNSALSLAQVQASFLAGGGLPSVAIGDAAVVEGDAATFTVTLNLPSTQTVTVNYATAGGTATSGSDFLAGGGVVTFAPGETSKTIQVQTLDDVIGEVSETFVVNLSGAVGGTILDSQGLGTIVANDLPPGLVSYWTGDNTSLDAAGSNHGTLYNGATYATGQVGQAFKLDGVNDRIGITDSASLKLTGSLSIEAWVKADAYPAGEGRILFRGDDRIGFDPYDLTLLNNGLVRFRVHNADNIAAAVTAPFPVGEFVHVTGTLDDATGAMRLYLNGVLVSQATTPVRPFADLDPLSNPGVGIGATGGYPGTSFTQLFTGLIDELKLYDIPLTGEQVLDNFNSTKGDLVPKISIGDASVIEGDSGFGDAGYFVAPDEHGLAAGRIIQLGPDGNVYVASHDTDSVKVLDQAGNYLGELTTPGGELDGPWGIVFGPDGKLYVGGRFSRNVVRFNLGTGEPEVFVSAAASGGLGAVRSLTFGPDGNLYVSSRMEGAPSTTDMVKRYECTTGAYVDDFVAAGSGGLNGANGVAFGPDGNLYVASTAGREVLRYDGQTGAFLDVFIPLGSGGLSNPQQFVFHTDGRLYVGDTASVRSYDAATGSFQSVVASGLPFSGSGIAFVTSGEMLVSTGSPMNVSGSAVRRFLPGFTSLHVSLSAPSANTVSVNYATADGTALAGADYIAASGTLTFAPGVIRQSVLVKVLDDSVYEGNETFTVNLSNPVGGVIADGQGVGTILDDEAGFLINDGAGSESGLIHSRGPFVEGLPGASFNPLTIGPDGNVYTAVGTGDGYNTIRRYDAATGDFLDTFVGQGRINGVRDILFRDGYAYVGSEYTDEVLRYDAATGAFVDAFVAAGSGGLGGTHGLAFGPDANGDGVGELYVSGRDTQNVVRYDGVTGQPLGSYVASGSGGLATPEGLTFDPSGSLLFVASTGSSRILKYDAATGAFIGIAATTNLSGPKDVKFGPDGLMYVTSGGNDRIVRFTAGGTYVDDYVPAGTAGLDNPSRLAFFGNDLFVTSTGNSQIFQFGNQAEAIFTVSLAGPVSSPVSVDFATANGSATGGSDYHAVAGTVTFAPGATTRVIRVPLFDDTIYEGNETFTVNLSNPVGGVILDGQGVGTIVDNDQQPTKFYVVDDGSTNKTFEYEANGSSVENYGLSSDNAAPRGAASTVAGDKTWVVDANNKVFVYDSSGNLLGSWTALGMKQLEGIATNGTDIWLVDGKHKRVFKFDGEAARLSGQSYSDTYFNLASGNGAPTDIVTDGASFWVLNAAANDKVFKYTLAGAALGNWTLSTSGAADPTGITLDPASPSHLWIVDSGTDRVYQYDGAVTRTSGSQAASASFALAAGNANPQGIADPPVSGEWSSDSAWLAAGPESIAAEVAAAWSGTRRRTDAIVADAAPLRLRQKEIVQPARLIVKDEPGLHHAGNNDEPEYRRRESNDSEASDEALLEVLDEWEIVRRG